MSTCGDTYLKTKLLTALAALLVVGACETLYEPYFLEREDIGTTNGVYFYSDLMEDSYDGTQHWQFAASNNNAWIMCVSTSLETVRHANGYSMGTVVQLGPYETKNTGYVYVPADYEVRASAWEPDVYGNC